MRWPQRYGLIHYTTRHWLCADGGQTMNPNDPDVLRFTFQGGGIRWLMRKAPEFVSAYRCERFPA